MALIAFAFIQLWRFGFSPASAMPAIMTPNATATFQAAIDNVIKSKTVSQVNNQKITVLATSTPVRSILAPTSVPRPTFTPYPTYTPMPSGGSYLAVAYSYFWPPFGPPNCSVAGWQKNYCSDTFYDGQRWEDWIGQGVAVPPSFLDRLPLGSYIYVHSPVEMIGRYRVVTTCAACLKDGYVYFDFLDNRQRLPWTTSMLIEILEEEK